MRTLVDNLHPPAPDASPDANPDPNRSFFLCSPVFQPEHFWQEAFGAPLWQRSCGASTSAPIAGCLFIVVLRQERSAKRRSVALFVGVSTVKPPPVVLSRRQNGIISLLHRDNLFHFSYNQADILSSADPEAFFLLLLLRKCQNDARLIIRAAPRAHCSLNPSRNGVSGKRQAGI